MSFDERNLKQRFQSLRAQQGLKPSQESIEIVSKYVLFLRSQARDVARVWEETVQESDPPRQLLLAYLANDILHKGRKRGIEFLDAFYPVLMRCLPTMLSGSPPAVRTELTRIIQLWIDQRHFGKSGSSALIEVVQHSAVGPLQDPPSFDYDLPSTSAPAAAPAATTGGRTLATRLKGRSGDALRALEAVSAASVAAQGARSWAAKAAEEASGAAGGNGMGARNAYELLARASTATEAEVAARNGAIEALRVAMAEQEALLAEAVKAQGELKTVMDSVMGRMGSTEAGAGGGEGGAGPPGNIGGGQEQDEIDEDDDDGYDPSSHGWGAGGGGAEGAVGYQGSAKKQRTE